MKKLPPFIRYDLPVIFKMALPTLFIVAVGIHFYEFIVHAIMANMAINMGIILAASFGVVIIFLRLFSLQRDMSGLDRFSREARSSGDMKTLIEMPWIKERSIWHYLEHIAYTEGTLATQLDQDALQNELAALSEEYNSKMELPQFLVGFMIAMGLLGTFIGLLETLTGISGMLDGMGHGGDIEKEFSKLVVELRKPLSGMGIAFSASMFGLVTSLQLSIMMIVLRRYTSRVLEKARSVMHSLLTRIKAQPAGELMQQIIVSGEESGDYSVAPRGSARNVDASFAGSAHHEPDPDAALNAASAALSDKISDAYFRSQDAITTMANSVTLLVKRMDSISRLLENNAAALDKTNERLSFGPRMTEANENLLIEVKNMASLQEDSQKLMQKVIGSLIQIDQSLMSNSTRDVVAAQREVAAVLSEMFSTSQTHTRLYSEFLDTQREGFRENALAIKNLNERVAKQDEIAISSSRHLSDIKDLFGKAVNSFTLIDAVAENIGRQTLMVEASMTEERNTSKALFSNMQRELQDFTSTLRQYLEKSGR